MSRILNFCLVVLALPVFAQAQSACNQASDPHSFACSRDTFSGGLFPIANMRSERTAFDNWTLLTYSDVNGVTGPEFDILVSSQNSHIPVGLVNIQDDSMAGSLEWNESGAVIRDWRRRGNSISARPGEAFITDSQTINVTLKNSIEQQGLQCRIFLRVGKDHLLCRWFTLINGKFVFRGYLGFGTSR